MNVVVSVAVDAEISGAREPLIVDVTAVATLLIVCSLEVEVPDIVQCNDVGETLRRVAGRAVGAKLAFVNPWLGVTSTTAVAVRWPRFERDARMAIGTANGQVLAGELEITLSVVIEDVLPGFEVAVFALVA